LFQKYREVVNRLRLSSHLEGEDKFLKMTVFYVNSHWILSVLAIQRFLGKGELGAEAVPLLAAATITMLGSEDLISDHLICMGKGAKVTQTDTWNEVCSAYGHINREAIAKSVNQVSDIIGGLREDGTLGSKWNSASLIQQSAEKIEAVYQRSLSADDIDLRFFLKEGSPKNIGASSLFPGTPLHKQKLVHKQYQPEPKNCNPRSLDYDEIIGQMQPPETPKTQVKLNIQPVQSSALGFTDTCFQRMVQSPYRAPAHPPATPLTKAMELTTWFAEAVSKPYVSQDGSLLEPRVKSPLFLFAQLAEADAKHTNLQDVILEKTSLLSQINTPRANKGAQGLKPDQIPKHEDKQLLYLNFYYYFLEAFITREQQWKGGENDSRRLDTLSKALVSPTFHKTLLVYAMEALYYVLNQKDVEFQAILDTIGLNVYRLYETNIGVLNFETLVPSTLRKHFFDVEKLILSFHIWEPQSPIFKKELTPEFNLIFERAMIHAGKLVASLGQQLQYSRPTLEKIWELFTKILATKRTFLAGRFMEQVVLCSFYVTSKIGGLGTKFQDVIVAFQKCYTWASPSLVNAVVFQCLVSGEERTDVISFYNKVFIGECEKMISQVRTKLSNPENVPMNGRRDENVAMGSLFGNLEARMGSPIGIVVKDGTKRMNQVAGMKSPPAAGHGLRTIQGGQGLDVLSSPLRDLMSTPFLAYNKNTGSVGQLTNMGSPVGMMLRIGSPSLKMPTHSKRILDLKGVEAKEDAPKRLRGFEKKETFVPVGFENFEDKLKKFI
jgi:hypothetical protein